MIEIIRERTLAAPVERVWDVIEPVEGLPEWFTGSETAELLSGQGLGRRQRLGGRWGRRRFEIDQTIIVHEPLKHLAWRHDAERLDGKPAPRISRETEFHLVLWPVRAGTRVRLVSRHVPGNAFKALVLRFTAAGRIARMMEASLDKLAELLAQRT